MAKDKKQEIEEAEESRAGASRGGATNVVLIVVASLISLGMGAGGAFFFASSQRPPADTAQLEAATAAAAAEEESAARKDVIDGFKERLYGLEPFVVNVTGDGYNRFLKLRLELETSDPLVKEELDARLPQIRDALIVLLSSKQLSDITDFEGKALLKEDILVRLNDLLETGSIQSALFTEFVVQ